jgi:PAS domain S-box-containing protein
MSGIGALRSWQGYLAGLVLLNTPALILLQYPGPCWMVGLSISFLGTLWLLAHGWMLHREYSQSQADSRLRAAQLEALVDSAADAILTCDDQGIIRSANRMTGRLFGYTSDALLGCPLKKILASDALAGLDTDEHRVLGIVTAYRGQRKDGSTFPITVAVSKIRLEGRALYTVIVHDQSALAQAREDAEAASRAKDAFLLGVSHELRTPLTAILATAELLADSELSAEQGKLVSTLVKSGDLLLSRVKQILDFSQLEMGQMRLKKEPFSLRSILCDLETQLQPVASSKNLAFEMHCQTPLPPKLLGDGSKLANIMELLLRNAIQFTEKGQIRLEVCYHENQLEITIHDTGAGMDQADQARLFRAFERADPLTPGLGLGLTLAARLTQLMGGQLHLTSSPGCGCQIRLRFCFESPFVSPHPPVLLALPDAALRTQMEATLQEIGYETIGVVTGRQALAEFFQGAVQGRPFGLVVLDPLIPDLTIEQWLDQAKSCAGWKGAVLLLGKQHEPTPPPHGVLAILDRDNPSALLGEMARRQLQAAIPA